MLPSFDDNAAVTHISLRTGRQPAAHYIMCMPRRTMSHCRSILLCAAACYIVSMSRHTISYAAAAAYYVTLPRHTIILLEGDVLLEGHLLLVVEGDVLLEGHLYIVPEGHLILEALSRRRCPSRRIPPSRSSF